MKKFSFVLLSVLLTIILFCGTVFAFASDENPFIKTGETHKGDFITGGYSVIHDGLIQGDLITATQTLSVRGEVEGDIIAGAADININGKVGGNVRVGGNNVNISSSIERNAMVFASNITISQNAIVKRNSYFFGNVLSITGTILGKTDVYGSDVTLGGRYEGDVVIHGMTEGSSIKLLSGTVIKGKLTYKGITEYKVPTDVQVGSYEYVKINPLSKAQIAPRYDLWSFAKKIFTLIVYYLFALLLYKLFPRFFVRSGDFIGAKPFSAAGIGIATLGSLVGGVIFLILLLILTIFIFQGSIFFFAGSVLTFVATLTILFADIPVSLWLGNILSRKTISVPARLAMGLAAITTVKLAFDLLENIDSISTFVGILSFLTHAAIWFLGTGSLLRIFFEICKSANVKAQEDETESEPLNF